MCCQNIILDTLTACCCFIICLLFDLDKRKTDTIFFYFVQYLFMQKINKGLEIRTLKILIS